MRGLPFRCLGWEPCSHLQHESGGSGLLLSAPSWSQSPWGIPCIPTTGQRQAKFQEGLPVGAEVGAGPLPVPKAVFKDWSL